MSQEWNWQIDELQSQEAYNASRIESAIRDQTEAINRVNSRNTYSTDTSRITDYIPKEKIKKFLIRLVLTLLCISALGWIVCFIITMLFRTGIIGS